MAASNVSAIPSVRAFLFDLQRDIAANNNCIMDGRDIGTVVLKDSKYKIFLTATAEERARRRFDELTARDIECSYDEILKDIIDRDYKDSHREVDPLKKADDAIEVDTTGLNIEQVTNKIISIIEGKNVWEM